MLAEGIEQSLEDTELSAAIRAEEVRQDQHIELIASENYTSADVMCAQGSVLTNKYAEGYPGKRYYGGCEHVDVIEQLAIDRAKSLYSAGYANVQPHSGSQANAAAFFALLEHGETFMGLDLGHGGHLTHGSPVNFSGKSFNVAPYGLDIKTGLLDYDMILDQAKKAQPKVIIAGYSAYSRTIDFPAFRDIADSVGAYLMADMAHISGLVAAGLHPNPVPYADVVTSTTHKTLRGPRGGMILAADAERWSKPLNSAIFPGLQGGPLLHVIAGKAICYREASQSTFKNYIQQVLDNAKVMADTMIDRGYQIISGGTDTHLFLVDLQNKNITGKVAQSWLEQASITTNKNSVPNDPQSPFVTSGIRIGSAAVTTRGFRPADCQLLASWMCDLLDHVDDTAVLEQVKAKVRDLCAQYPIYS